MNKNVLKLVVSGVAEILVLAGSFMVANNLSSMRKPPAKKPSVKRIKEVGVFTVKNETVPTMLEVDGELVAFNKIDIFAEVSGTLESTSRPFKVGSYFPKGSVLIKINQEEAKLALLSQKSTLLNSITQMMPDLKIDYPESFQNWNNYLESFNLEAPVVDFPEPINKQEKYFVAARNLQTQFYNIKSAEERLEKYTLTAPFSGVITQTSINSGAVVRVGQKLGELMNNANYELEVTIPLSDLKYVQNGYKVTLSSDDMETEWAGRIKRVDNQVDASTQTVKVFVDVRGQNLREGMYMRGELEGSNIENAIQLPRELLIDQKAVYVLKDTVLRLQSVEVVKITEDAAVVRGLEDGTKILREMIPGLFDGVRVNIYGLGENEGEASLR